MRAVLRRCSRAAARLVVGSRVGHVTVGANRLELLVRTVILWLRAAALGKATRDLAKDFPFYFLPIDRRTCKSDIKRRRLYSFLPRNSVIHPE